MTVRISWYGGKAKAAAHRGAVRGLYLGTEHVVEETNRVIPIEESTLLKTGTPSVDAGALRGAASWDGPYAVRQHEELTWHHDPGRKAKYLEDTINSGGVQQAVNGLYAREIKAALG